MRLRALLHLLCGATLVALAVALSPARANDPTSKAECLQMVRAPLEAQCRALFAGDGERSSREACLVQVEPQLERVCEQFFGGGGDFCAACTSSCNRSFPAGDTRRRDCLTMCIRQPGCN